MSEQNTKPSGGSRCATCGGTLGPRNKTGYCRLHVSAFNALNPEFRRRQSEGAKRKYREDPDYAARHRASLLGPRCRNPQATAARRASMKANRIWELGHAATPAGSEARIRAGVSISAAANPWCPRDYIPKYLELKNRLGLSRAAAKRAVLDIIARDQARAALQAAAQAEQARRYPPKVRADDIPSEMERMAQQWAEQGRAAA